MTESTDKIELEEAGGIEPVEDRRRKIEEPPPVRLEAVDDCWLVTHAGVERELDDFYVGVLGFERDLDERGIVYRAENFRLRFTVVEVPPARTDYRPLMVTVPSLDEVIERLREAEVEFERVKSIRLGSVQLLMADPAGNPVEVNEVRVVI
jgi:hypothetical protein